MQSLMKLPPCPRNRSGDRPGAMTCTVSCALTCSREHPSLEAFPAAGADWSFCDTRHIHRVPEHCADVPGLCHSEGCARRKKKKTCVGGKSLSPCYMHGVCPSKPEALLSLPAFSSTLLSTSPTRGILHAKYKCVAKIKAKL